jgi:Cu(I)/Ag(I) efflux system membrane fusion protein
MTVYRIADLSHVWLEADVFEKDLAHVAAGQGALVSFEAYPRQVFKGRVTYVYPTVSVQARTGRVRVDLLNPRLELKPGMFAHIHLDVPQEAPTLVVPRSAVIATGERALVFVRGSDGTLVPREVRMGRTSGPEQELLGGVREGERIVSSAAFLVDAESNLGGMAMPGMDMGAPGSDSMEGMDHSGHDMGSMTPDSGAASSGAGSHQGHGG